MYVKLKNVVLPASEFVIRSVDDRIVTIDVRTLSAKSERMVIWALGCIKARYRPEVFSLPFDAIWDAATSAAFIQSDSREVGAYARKPWIILNRRRLRPKGATEKTELVVTILHELLHTVLEGQPEDKGSRTKFEALFDMDCYRALGFSVPDSHWGWGVVGRQTAADPGPQDAPH